MAARLRNSAAAESGGEPEAKEFAMKRITAKETRPNNETVFVVRLKATDGDGVRALKSFLKAALRRHGLKALSVVEETGAVPS
jgi:hypothetical protein